MLPIKISEFYSLTWVFLENKYVSMSTNFLIRTIGETRTNSAMWNYLSRFLVKAYTGSQS